MAINLWKSLKAVFGWTIPAVTIWTSIWSPKVEAGRLEDSLWKDGAASGPDPVTFSNTLNANIENIYAAHRSHSSHSSHRSHSSHASHYSSSGSGGYSLPAPRSPSVIPPSSPTPSAPSSPSQPPAPSTKEVARLTLTADTLTLVADGLSSTTITASLVNSLGQPSPDRLLVTFLTDMGHFRAIGYKYADGRTSGRTGTVRVSFTSDRDVVGTASIIAQVQGMTQTLQIALTALPSQLPMPHTSTVKPHASPEALANVVLRVQIALSLKGYQPGSLDGVLGPQTRTALQMFQRDQGIPATGRMETATLDALGIKLS
jgi:hypothetical protein